MPIVSGIILGMMYLAGHPQSTLYFTFFLAMLALYELVYRARHKNGELGFLDYSYAWRFRSL